MLVIVYKGIRVDHNIQPKPAALNFATPPIYHMPRLLKGAPHMRWHGRGKQKKKNRPNCTTTTTHPSADGGLPHGSPPPCLPCTAAGQVDQRQR